MVFFTCGACGEALKKAQVEKHAISCRRRAALCCIDCGTEFWGDDYKSHVKCISEDQKYGGKNYEAKANKGDVKQQQWIQKIHEAMSKAGINPKLKDVLNQVCSYDNVPRKKAKFQNWMKNSLKIHNSSLQDQVWEIVSAASVNGAEQSGSVTLQNTNTAPPHPAHTQEQGAEEEKPNERKKNKRERKEERQKKKKEKKDMKNGSVEEEQNGEMASDEQPRKKKKRKREADECGEEITEDRTTKKAKKKKEEASEAESPSLEVEEEQEEQNNTKGKFNWKGTIKAVLKQTDEDGLSVKKLRKKVLAAYYSFSGDENYRTEEELYSLFNKKLNNPKFRILKDKVRLVK